MQLIIKGETYEFKKSNTSGNLFTFERGVRKYYLTRQEAESKIQYLRAWLDGYSSRNQQPKDKQDTLATLTRLLAEFPERSIENEKQDTTPNPEELGFCAMCGKPMSWYDWWHSQGSHCAKCFSQIQGDVHLKVEVVGVPPPLKGYENGFSTN